MEINAIKAKELNVDMSTYDETFRQKSLEFVGMINKLLDGSRHKFSFDKSAVVNIIDVVEDKAGSYNDDGCTKSAGREWSGYVAFPFFKPTASSPSFTKGSIEGEYCDMSLVISYTSINERISDGRIEGCRFNTISIVYAEFIGDMFNRKDRFINKSAQIGYTNNNYADFSAFSDRNVIKSTYWVLEILDVLQLTTKLDKINFNERLENLKPKEEEV